MSHNDDRMYHWHDRPESRLQMLAGFLFTEIGRWLLVLCDTRPVRCYDACVAILREPR